MNLTERQRFLRDEIHGLTLAAAFGVRRAPIYAEGVSDTERNQLQTGLRRALEELVPKYAGPVTHTEHVQCIIGFATRLSSDYKDILHSGRFRIGVAQKAINLFLKYLWCLDLIPTPPHCPFDALIINKLPPDARVNWTTLDDVQSYERLVSAARRKAGEMSLPEWELAAYNTVSVGASRTIGA